MAAALLHEINYRLLGGTDWIAEGFKAGVTTWQSSVLEDGAQYEVRLRAITGAGTPGEWTATETVTATADTTAPGQPTGLSSSKLADDVTLSWTNPNSANFFETRVYRNTVNNFGTATQIARVFGGTGAAKSYPDNNLANGTYYWWVKALNASGVGSTEVGPQTQTIP